MSKQDEFPKPDNSPVGKEARLARILASERERRLSEISKEFYPLERKIRSSIPEEEIDRFLKKFSEIIKNLLRINPFENDPALKTECEEVLVLLEDKNKEQIERYSKLLCGKLWNFFTSNKIFPQEKIPD